jgi:hypothetical protein
MLAGSMWSLWRAGLGQCKDVTAASADVMQASTRAQMHALNTQVGIALHPVVLPHRAHTTGMQYVTACQSRMSMAYRTKAPLAAVARPCITSSRTP